MHPLPNLPLATPPNNLHTHLPLKQHTSSPLLIAQQHKKSYSNARQNITFEKKKARNANLISSTTEHNEDIIQTTATTATSTTLKQDILTTIQAEVHQMIQTNLQPLEHKLKSMHQTITTLATQITADMQQFHQKLNSSQDHFQIQLAQLMALMKVQQAQFDAKMQVLFTSFSQLLPLKTPPSIAP